MHPFLADLSIAHVSKNHDESTCNSIALEILIQMPVQRLMHRQLNQSNSPLIPHTESSIRSNQKFLLGKVIKYHIALVKRLLIHADNDGGMAVSVLVNPYGIFAPPETVQRVDHLELVRRERERGLRGDRHSSLAPEQLLVLDVHVGVFVFGREVLLVLRAVQGLVGLLDLFPDLADPHRHSILFDVEACLAGFVELDAAGAANRLDDGVDQVADDSNWNDHGDGQHKGDPLDPFPSRGGD